MYPAEEMIPLNMYYNNEPVAESTAPSETESTEGVLTLKIKEVRPNTRSPEDHRVSRTFKLLKTPDGDFTGPTA